MKKYPESSTLTIRNRIEQLIARRPKDSKDVWVNVYDNTTGYSDANFSFFLNDWDSPFDDFREYKELDHRLDTENMSSTGEKPILNLGFDHFKKGIGDE